MLEKLFIEKALDLANNNILAFKGGPFGAVIVKNNQIIAIGANTVTTTNDPTAHAEINAIRLACKNLNTFVLDDCEIYCSCEPCPMCLSAVYWARIRKVYYAATHFDAKDAGFDDSFIYEEIGKPIEQRSIKFMQLSHEEGKKILQQWVACEHKTAY